MIDDQPDTLSTMEALLAKLGHDVVTVMSGGDAFRTMAGFRPEVIFSDIGLPGLDGYAIARRVRLDPDLRSTWLVAVTGYGQAADQRRAYDAGFDVHLTKPVAFSDLSRALSDVPGPESRTRSAEAG